MKPVTNGLIVAGINPLVLYKALDGYINDMITEDERMEKYNARPSAQQEKLRTQVYKLHEALDQENEITTPNGQLKTGMN